MINKKEVLEALYREFSEVEQLTELNPEEKNNIVDMVVTEFRGIGKKLEEVLAELFFLPQPIKDPKYEMFTITITLDDDYKGKRREALLEALNFINYNLPFGAFSLDSTGTTILLKYTVLLDPNMEMDDVMEILNYSIMSLVSFAGLWMDAIFDVINGNTELDALKTVIGMK